MTYLYHLKPKDMSGNILFPLNKLKEIDLDLYAKKAKKYEGREETMRHVIPYLNCLWNDAIHLSPVDPRHIKFALTEAGMKEIPPITYFEIDSELLEPENTAVYLFKYPLEKKLQEDNFEKYDQKNISKYSNLPEETKEYFKRSVAAGSNPLGFFKIPHILYKGTIDTSKVRQITI